MAKPSKGKYDDNVVAFVNNYWKKHFRSPTLDEVMKACGITSKSVARYVVQKLFYVEDYSARGIIPAWVRSAIRSASHEGQA
jgi:sulfur relay (sulfurtransferase) DsrC/TusE family protein